MEVLSLLVIEGGSIKAVSSRDLLPEHRLIAAYVQGEDGPVLARHVDEGPVKLETSIGVKWFDHSVDKSVIQFDLFQATNESRISYPPNLVGRHEIDKEAVENYKIEAMKRLEAAVKRQAFMSGNLSKDLEIQMPRFEFLLNSLMQVKYVTETQYMAWMDGMVARIIRTLQRRQKWGLTLVIDEDANSPGNLIALACWERIKGFVTAVVVCNEDGFTAKSKKIASRYPPRYITFFDAIFSSLEVEARARSLEAAERQFNQELDDADREWDFSVIFAAPCSAAVGNGEYAVRSIFREEIRGSVFFAQGESFAFSRHNGASFSESLVIQLLGGDPGRRPFYTDRCISYPDQPLKFLTGYMGLFRPDKDSKEYTEHSPLVQNYEIDRDFMHFADSIDYRFFAWTSSGEPKMQSVTDMSMVLFPKRPL